MTLLILIIIGTVISIIHSKYLYTKFFKIVLIKDFVCEKTIISNKRNINLQSICEPVLKKNNIIVEFNLIKKKLTKYQI